VSIDRQRVLLDRCATKIAVGIHTRVSAGGRRRGDRAEQQKSVIVARGPLICVYRSTDAAPVNCGCGNVHLSIALRVWASLVHLRYRATCYGAAPPLLKISAAAFQVLPTFFHATTYLPFSCTGPLSPRKLSAYVPIS